MNLILGIVAFILVIIGVIQLLQGALIYGLVLIIAGLLIGPGGYSVTRTRMR
ncbi:MAG: GPGG-motif small membrane protein [Acidimicrobiia bacterium]